MDVDFVLNLASRSMPPPVSRARTPRPTLSLSLRPVTSGDAYRPGRKGLHVRRTKPASSIGCTSTLNKPRDELGSGYTREANLERVITDSLIMDQDEGKVNDDGRVQPPHVGASLGLAGARSSREAKRRDRQHP